MAISRFRTATLVNGFPKYQNLWDTNYLPVSGYSVWLDASDASTITYSSGSLVSAWKDKSGNGYDFTMATTSKQPTLTTNLQNGLPGIKFYDNGTAGKYLGNSSFNFDNSAFTFFVVFNSTSSGANYPALLGRNTPGGVQLGGNNAGPSALSISKIGTATQNSSLSYTGSNADVAVYRATAGISSGSLTVRCYLNGGTATADITQTGLGSGNSTVIGASADGAGDSMAQNAYICEIIVYLTALSNSDRNKVEAYLKAKWGTP